MCANLCLCFQAGAMLPPIKHVEEIDSITAELNKQLLDIKVIGKLNYPISVKRFYKSNGLKPNWLVADTNIGPVASAMLLLDCVRQFGLQREQYHPEIVNYNGMYSLLNDKLGSSIKNKVMFELMLTDAVISMINHLHYGRFNPIYSLEVLENDPKVPIRADEWLLRVAKSSDLMYAILDLQPRISQYQQLQNYMKLIVGQYVCDSYEVPESEIRTVAINMERLRWMNAEEDAPIQINIPSFQLTYSVLNSVRMFKVVVGKSSTQTPIILSNVDYIETAPDWNIPHKIFIDELLPKAEKDNSFFDNAHIAVYNKKGNLMDINAETLKTIRKKPNDFHAKQSAGCDNALGSVVFRFSNNYGIYLHDTPQQQYFSKRNRALSHGCIRVEGAQKLARLVLVNDGQAENVKTLDTALVLGKNLKLKLALPLPISITYQTVIVRDGLLVRYNDIYKLDKVLEAKLYGKNK